MAIMTLPALPNLYHSPQVRPSAWWSLLLSSIAIEADLSGDWRVGRRETLSEGVPFQMVPDWR